MKRAIVVALALVLAAPGCLTQAVLRDAEKGPRETAGHNTALLAVLPLTLAVDAALFPLELPGLIVTTETHGWAGPPK